jgi:hypothetical protein
VQVTDVNGCIGTGSGILTVNTAATVTVNNNSICDGDDPVLFTAAADIPILSYNWTENGSGTNPTTSGNTPGNYTVQVVDENNCEAMATGVLTVNGLPAVTVNSETICDGEPDATFTASAPTAISFLWSENGTGTIGTSPGNIPGNYTVLVTDADGCSASATGTLTISSLPVVSTGPGFNTNYDISEGNINLTFGLPSGGNYSGDGVSSNVFNTLSAGNGSHVITYSYQDPLSGCSSDTNLLITVSTATYSADINDSAIRVYPNPFRDQLQVLIPQGVVLDQYELVDASGKTVILSTSLDAGVIRTNQLAPGIYLIRIRSQNQISTLKLVKSGH